jgi:parallel beta-helix repeat protein
MSLHDHDGLLKLGNQVTNSKNISLQVEISSGDLVFYKGDTAEIYRIYNQGNANHNVANVWQYGVVGGGANDTAAIQAAINDNYGGSLYFPGGNYYTTGLTITGEIQLFGDGYSRSGLYLYPGTANANVVHVVNSSHFTMMDMLISGNKAACPSGYSAVRLEGSNTGAAFYRCFFVDSHLDGLAQVDVCDNIILKDCIAEANDAYGIDLATASGIIDNCRCVVNGSAGIVVTGDNLQITNNRCYGNGRNQNGSGISAVGSDYLTITGNMCFGNGVASTYYGHGIGVNGSTFYTIADNYCNGNIGNGIDATLSSPNGTITGNVCFANFDNGIAVDSRSDSVTISTNHIRLNYNAGISLFASAYCSITSNIIQENGLNPTACVFAGSTPNPYGISMVGYDNGGIPYYNYYTIISDNQIIFNNYAGTGAGIFFQEAMITKDYSVTLTNNNILYNTLPVTYGTGSLGTGSKIRDNRGFVTENNGTATITAALTAVTVTHGLSYTPAAKDITWSLTSGPTNDIGDQWITGLTSTQFVLNCRNVPGAGGAVFNWKASRN